jgi:uncharacterized protein (TIGR00369 family)
MSIDTRISLSPRGDYGADRRGLIRWALWVLCREKVATPCVVGHRAANDADMDATHTPDADGWVPWIARPDGRFHDLLGQMYFRVTANGVESRMDTDRRHSNGLGFLHGGFLMSFVDMAMFTIIRPRFVKGEGAVTLSCATDFLTGGIPGEPIEGHGEVLKETGKLFFVRGLVTQGGANVVSFTGTMRKITRRLPVPPTA